MSSTRTGDPLSKAGALTLVREHVVFLREMGVREIPRVAGKTNAPETAAAGKVRAWPEHAPSERPASEPSPPRLPGARSEAAGIPLGPPGLFDERFELPEGVDQAGALEMLRAEEIGECTRCKLCRGRTHIVFGSGNPRARLMFVGEGPGADEDEQGLPFVGRAGQKLTEMIEKGMGIPRSDCYIANIIKCRPPENRDPEPDEIAACEGFLFKQIDIIRPRVIVALGRFAAQTLLRTKMPISSLRGRFWKYRDTLLMPTFHPAFLLRQYTAENRRIVWEDLKMVQKALEEAAAGE